MLDHDKNVYTSLATFSLTSAGGSAVDPTNIGADNETAAVSNLTAEQLPSFFSSTAKIVVSKGEKELFYDVKIDKTLPGASGTTAIAYVDATAVANSIHKISEISIDSKESITSDNTDLFITFYTGFNDIN